MIRDLLRIKFDAHYFCVPRGIVTHLSVVGVFFCATRIPGCDCDHSTQHFKYRLGAPETAAAKYCKLSWVISIVIHTKERKDKYRLFLEETLPRRKPRFASGSRHQTPQHLDVWFLSYLYSIVRMYLYISQKWLALPAITKR